jgi:hypothetical protein
MAGIISWDITNVIYNNTKNFDMLCNKDSYGSISNLNKNNDFGFRQFRAKNSLVSGDISGLSNSPNITIVELSNSQNVTGDIKSLGSCTNLQTILVDYTGVTGTIEGFVAAQISNGRATCDSLKTWYILSKTSIKFGGSQYYGPDYLSWDDHKIVMFNESTIASSTIIWAKGATASEISAWKQAGKTVIVVS